MNNTQYTLLQEFSRKPACATGENLKNKEPRTLIYGYTWARDTFHVYLGSDAQIHLVTYTHDKIQTQHICESEGITLSSCVPDKRVYPEACDYEFCMLLTRAGIKIPFTTWGNTSPDDGNIVRYNGLLAEDLITTYTLIDFQLPKVQFELLVENVLGSWTNESFAQALMLAALNTAEAYTRAQAPGLDKPNSENADGWWSNMASSLDFLSSRFNMPSLAETQKQQLVEGSREIAQSRLTELALR